MGFGSLLYRFRGFFWEATQELRGISAETVRSW
jgi:hypothetical protein